MADAKKELAKLQRSLYFIILLAVGGIVLFISSFFYGIKGLGILMLVLGVLLAFGSLVFGIPLIAVRNSERRKTLKIAVIASQSERTLISVLAGSVGCNDATAREKVLWCMSHGYLDGYMISGNEVCHSRLFDPNLQEHAVECPNCGASFTYVGKIGQCPYCGDYYPPQNKH